MEQLNLKRKPLIGFRVPSGLSLMIFIVFKNCKMDAQSAYSIYIRKETHFVQSENWKNVLCLKLSKTYFGKKKLFP